MLGVAARSGRLLNARSARAPVRRRAHRPTPAACRNLRRVAIARPPLFGALSGITATKATLTSLRMENELTPLLHGESCRRDAFGRFGVDVVHRLKRATNAVFRSRAICSIGWWSQRSGDRSLNYAKYVLRPAAVRAGGSAFASRWAFGAIATSLNANCATLGPRDRTRSIFKK